MSRTGGTACLALGLGLVAGAGAQSARSGVQVNWDRVSLVSRSTPTLQVVVNPRLAHGGDLNEASFAALKELGADYVRYVPWLPYPKQAVAELEPPTNGKTSWDFSHIDPTLEDFMKATEGHSVVMNFSHDAGVDVEDGQAGEVSGRSQPGVLGIHAGYGDARSAFKEAADYYARLLSWYTKGGFTDEFGKWHESGHHYKFAYWEVLNEIDFEHNWTPRTTRSSTTRSRRRCAKVDPDIKFMALAWARRMGTQAMFEYFLNPANHAAGVRAGLHYVSLLCCIRRSEEPWRSGSTRSSTRSRGF